ncbi:hypothetical protein ABZ653_24995, partial [Streptomyces sp. NPDC007083]
LRAAATGAFRPLRIAVAAVGVFRDPGPVLPPRASAPGAPPALPLLTHSVHRRGPPARTAVAPAV